MLEAIIAETWCLLVQLQRCRVHCSAALAAASIRLLLPVLLLFAQPLSLLVYSLVVGKVQGLRHVVSTPA
jgi:hypothetical protein